MVVSIPDDSSHALNSSRINSPPHFHPRPPHQLVPYLHSALALLLHRTRPCQQQILPRLLLIAVRDLIFTPIPRPYFSTQHPPLRRSRSRANRYGQINNLTRHTVSEVVNRHSYSNNICRRSNRYGLMDNTRCTAPDFQGDYYIVLVQYYQQARNH